MMRRLRTGQTVMRQTMFRMTRGSTTHAAICECLAMAVLDRNRIPRCQVASSRGRYCGIVMLHTPSEVNGRAGHATERFSATSTEERAVPAVVPSTEARRAK